MQVCIHRLFLSDRDREINVYMHLSTQELLSHGSHAISIFPADNQKKKNLQRKALRFMECISVGFLFPNIKAIISNYANFMESRDIHIHFI